MTADVWIGLRTRATYLNRLSVVFAADLRLKLVTELYLREMSATEFYAEFGGGSISRVDRHIKKLDGERWLRLVRTETGGERRGGVEHYYRATELAIFDHETWSLLPFSIRVAFSWRTHNQLEERVRTALEAGTLEARRGSSSSCEQLLLDEEGWTRMIAAVDQLFLTLFEEQIDVNRRIQRTKERPFTATVSLIAFESPQGDRTRRGPQLMAAEKIPLVPFPVRFSKVIADPINLQIVAEANRREISAPVFIDEFGGDSPAAIRRRFKMLEATSWTNLTSELTGGRRHGAKERFYRALGPAVSPRRDRDELPEPLWRKPAWQTFERIDALVREAVVAGVLDARTDRYLTWSLLRLDRLGWEKTTAAVDELRVFAQKEQDDAGQRLRASGGTPVKMTLGLAAFESPPHAQREH